MYVFMSSSYLSLPLSVYFNAIRSDPYVGGGEEYLTFSSCLHNAGGAMDAKSGVFTAPIAGAYLFAVHVCSHDMKKVTSYSYSTESVHYVFSI